MFTITTRGFFKDVLELLGPNGEHWIKKESKIEDNYCLLGAINAVITTIQQKNEEIKPSIYIRYGEIARSVYPMFYKFMNNTKQSMLITEWNDDPFRTWEDVKAFLTFAIEYKD